jgi:hypothetical protein
LAQPASALAEVALVAGLNAQCRCTASCQWGADSSAMRPEGSCYLDTSGSCSPVAPDGGEWPHGCQAAPAVGARRVDALVVGHTGVSPCGVVAGALDTSDGGGVAHLVAVAVGIGEAEALSHHGGVCHGVWHLEVGGAVCTRHGAHVNGQ